jgi:molybdate/tungstate transport system substrate-binding protein
VVAQHNLKYLELPPEINLGDREMAAKYKQVKVKIDFRRFKSVIPEFEGLPIIYGMAVPATTLRQKEAIRFLKFVMGPEGQRIFTENHHPPLNPPECDNLSALPTELNVVFDYMVLSE